MDSFNPSNFNPPDPRPEDFGQENAAFDAEQLPSGFSEARPSSSLTPISPLSRQNCYPTALTLNKVTVPIVKNLFRSIAIETSPEVVEKLLDAVAHRRAIDYEKLIHCVESPLAVQFLHERQFKFGHGKFEDLRTGVTVRQGVHLISLIKNDADIIAYIDLSAHSRTSAWRFCNKAISKTYKLDLDSELVSKTLSQSNLGAGDNNIFLNKNCAITLCHIPESSAGADRPLAPRLVASKFELKWLPTKIEFTCLEKWQRMEIYSQLACEELCALDDKNFINASLVSAINQGMPDLKKLWPTDCPVTSTSPFNLVLLRGVGKDPSLPGHLRDYDIKNIHQARLLELEPVSCLHISTLKTKIGDLAFSISTFPTPVEFPIKINPDLTDDFPEVHPTMRFEFDAEQLSEQKIYELWKTIEDIRKAFDLPPYQETLRGILAEPELGAAAFWACDLGKNMRITVQNSQTL